MAERTKRPLQVVELAQGIAGPACGRLFTGLGHTVVKCEPIGGDYLRGGRERAAAPDSAEAGLMASGFAVLNAGKRSVELDLGSPEGRHRVSELLDSADVVVTDLSAALLDELQLRGSARAARRPGLVVVSLSNFGLDGDWPAVRPDSLLAESFGGLASMIGEPDARPLSLGGEQAAYAAGFVAFFGAMLALQEPGGDVVDVALSDVAAYIDWKSDVSFEFAGVAPRRTGVRFGRWRMVPAADGWAGVIYQPEQWDAMVALIDDTRLRDPRLVDETGRDALSAEWWPAVEEWAAALPRNEIFERAQRLGLAFGMSMNVADLVASPQYLARGFMPSAADGGARSPLGAFFRSDELGWSTGPVPALGEHDGWGEHAPALRAVREPKPAASAPLRGMVVLDLGTITAGAATGRLLADYGATVVKIESADHPDSFRSWIVAGSIVTDRGPDAVSPAFESNNAGKLGIVLDLKSDEGREQFHRLVADAHVVIENFRVGVTERLGVDYETLRELNPELIYLSLSSQGQDGPEAKYRSYGSTLDLLSGLASVTGYGDGRPTWSSVDVNYPDQLVSPLGAAIVSYCWNRGIGTHIDLSQREAVSWALADRIDHYRATGQISGATGNRRAGAVPHDVYPCAGTDHWVAIACFADAERAALASLLGVAPIPAGSSGSGDAEAIDDAISAWTGTRSREQCVTELSAAGIPCAPVLSADERARHPHFLSRRVFLNGENRRKGFPFVLEGYTPPAPARAPLLGEHTSIVLGDGGLLERQYS